MEGPLTLSSVPCVAWAVVVLVPSHAHDTRKQVPVSFPSVRLLRCMYVWDFRPLLFLLWTERRSQTDCPTADREAFNPRKDHFTSWCTILLLSWLFSSYYILRCVHKFHSLLSTYILIYSWVLNGTRICAYVQYHTYRVTNDSSFF